ncbi:hypothetical protein FBZ33_4075 [Micromonospora sp. A202]|nr:hypothetical protein FBZ33_4075 [Micromonospora sp. A202]
MPHLSTSVRRPLPSHAPAPQSPGYDSITRGTAGIGCTPTAAIVGGAR